MTGDPIDQREAASTLRRDRGAASHPDSRRTRLVGAAVALGLDAVVFGTGSVLAAARVENAVLLVVVAALGFAVAPIVGWRFAREAVAPVASSWPANALLMTIALGLLASGISITAVLAVGGFPGPAGSEAGFLLFAAFESLIHVPVATVLLAVPLGVVWRQLLRRLVRDDARLPPPAPAVR